MGLPGVQGQVVQALVLRGAYALLSVQVELGFFVNIVGRFKLNTINAHTAGAKNYPLLYVCPVHGGNNMIKKFLVLKIFSP